jgi:hypothetical protein
MADSWVKILTISEAKNRWGCYLMALSLNRSAFVGRSGRHLVRSVSLSLTTPFLNELSNSFEVTDRVYTKPCG